VLEYYDGVVQAGQRGEGRKGEGTVPTPCIEEDSNGGHGTIRSHLPISL